MASHAIPQLQLKSTDTAVALVVPKHLQAEINSLRSIHDKTFGKWDPHINIIYPFVEPARLPSAFGILRATLQDSDINKIRITTPEVDVFEHRKNATVFLKPSVESSEKICRLRKILVEALGCRERDGTYDGVFRPHLGVGQAALRGTYVQDLVEQVRKLVGLDWEAMKIAFLKRQMSGEMKVVDEIRLGSSQEPPSHSNWNTSYTYTNDKGWSRHEKLSTPYPILSDGGTQISLLTYNLMSDPNSPPFAPRLPLIINALSSAKLMDTSLRVLCLQEVDDAMLPLLLAEPFIREKFPFSSHMPSSLLPSKQNIVTFASASFESFALQFRERHKTALVVSFGEHALKVANVHLTSALTSQAVDSKLNQMKSLVQSLEDEHDRPTSNYFIAGDFNITTSCRTINAALSSDIIDLETAEKLDTVINKDLLEDAFTFSQFMSTNENKNFKGEEGATFDRSSNPLTALSSFQIDKSPQRYDRVLFSKRSHIQTEEFEIIGLPDENGLCGSDHFGISASFKIGRGSDTTISQFLPETSSLEIMNDSTNVQALLEPLLPTAEDRNQRLEAIELLRTSLSPPGYEQKLFLAPLGSYLMDTWFPDSDVDVLAMGIAAPNAFFDNATTQLQKITDENGEEGFKGLHFVNSLVSIIEVKILGIKFDLQYCQAPELVKRYYCENTPQDLLSLVFDTDLISSLSPPSLRPLNTFRDTAYLLTTIPQLPSYRTAHRYLSLYLKSRGLYAAKFSYLGGIHLSLMLNRLLKLIPQLATTSPATIIRSFLTYYSRFNYALDTITDPTLPSHCNPQRSFRDAIFIYAIHTPTARPNVSSSCTTLTAQSLAREFAHASTSLAQGDWGSCISRETGIADFFGGFGAFIVITVDIWDLDETSNANVRGIIGGIESKFPRLMVALSHIEGLYSRVWPAKFASLEEENARTLVMTEGKFKAYYLVGVSARDGLDVHEKRLFSGKVLNIIREFEENFKGLVEDEDGNIWVGMELLPRKRVMELGLVVVE